MSSLWKLEKLDRPTDAHAADAIEIIDGEAVRRVGLSQFDYRVLLARNVWFATRESEPTAFDLVEPLESVYDVVAAALQRLQAAGIIKNLPRVTLQ